MRRILILSLAFVSILFYTDGALAYDEQTTHPALTQEIVDFYNLTHPHKPLTAEEKEWVIEGSILEDTPPRWINHFFDPVHNIAWTGARTGRISADVMRAFRSLALAPSPPLTALEWLTSPLVQEEYKRYGGDRSWKRGLDYYATGDKKQAFLTLGHALHLLEDMGVPEHTRNDPHAHDLEKVTGDYGSPLEEYAKKWTRENIKKLNIIQTIQQSGKAIPQKTDPKEYLKSVADYSNRYFFTKDTINDPEYPNPKIIFTDDSFGYGVDENGDQLPLARARTYMKNSGKIVTEYSLATKKEEEILSAYFSRLSREIVLHGAGMIELWRKQAEEAVVNKEFPARLVALDPRVGRFLTFPIISPVGEGVRIASRFRSFVATVADAVGGIGSSFIELLPSRTIVVVAENPNLLSPSPKDNGLAVVLPPDQKLLPLSSSAIIEPDSVSLPVPSNAATSPRLVSAPTPRAPPPRRSGSILGSQTQRQVPLPPSTPLQLSAFRANIFPEDNRLPQAPSSIFVGGSGSLSPQGGVIETVASAPATGTASETSSSSSLSPSSFSSWQSSFIASYDAASQLLMFSWNPWQPPLSSSWSSSLSVRYTLSDITDTNAPLVLATTTATSTSLTVQDLGREYVFSLLAEDTASSTCGEPCRTTATTSISVPGFLSSLYLYRDTRAGNSTSPTADRYVVDFTPASSHPLWDPKDRIGNINTRNWKLLLFYLNQLPSREAQLTTRENLLPSDTAPLRLAYTACHGGVSGYTGPLIIPWNQASCDTGGDFSGALTVYDLEDTRLYLTTAQSTVDLALAPSDYLTVALYDFAGGGGGALRFRLRAMDAEKRFFRETLPSMKPPTIPGGFTLSFDVARSLLTLSWDASTDPDTLDRLITYEISATPSTSLRGGTIWRSVGNARTGSIEVVFPNTYTVGVRAVDDFGNASEPATQEWNFPEGYVPLPEQRINIDPVGPYRMAELCSITRDPYRCFALLSRTLGEEWGSKGNSDLGTRSAS